MNGQFSAPLSKIINEMKLNVLFMPEGGDRIMISSTEINRPGLQFAGFYDYFDAYRIQMIGKSEFGFLGQLPRERQVECIEHFFAAEPVAAILTRGHTLDEDLMTIVRRYKTPVLMTEDATTPFSSRLSGYLNVELAPRITRHGVLVEVYGEGVLLMGDSGVGKSETAIELVKRGHRLIADDAVEVRKVSSNSLVGTAPENIRHFLELRGVGIVNVLHIFGVGAVKVDQSIDFIINMEAWDRNKVYDRMGMDEETTDILGVRVPSITIPVTPGRNLAVIIEVAAINHRQKMLGNNAAHELLKRLGMEQDIPEEYRNRESEF